MLKVFHDFIMESKWVSNVQTEYEMYFKKEVRATYNNL